jgi:hypothetical protein
MPSPSATRSQSDETHRPLVVPLHTRLFRALLPAFAILAAAAAAQQGPPPHAGPHGLSLSDIDRIAIVFPYLEADLGSGAPTVTGRVEWIEGPFHTPVMAGEGGDTTHEAHLTIAIDAPQYHRWGGPPGDLPGSVPADITGDGVVDIADFSALMAAWGHSTGDLPPVPPSASP